MGLEVVKSNEQLRKYILRKLGACNVGVELSPEQVDDAIQDSLDLFNNYLCRAVPNVLASQSGSVVIPLAETVRGVVNVKLLLPNDTRAYAQISVWELMYRMMWPRLPVSEWYTLKMYYEMYQRVRGTEPDWYEDESTNALYVDCHSGPYDIFYVTSEDLTVEQIPHLKSAYTRDFRKLAVAEAKITLSRIRGKYGNSIPVPGGTLSTDAASLLQEGTAEKTEVEVKLDQIARFTVSPVEWC